MAGRGGIRPSNVAEKKGSLAWIQLEVSVWRCNMKKMFNLFHGVLIQNCHVALASWYDRSSIINWGRVLASNRVDSETPGDVNE